MLAGNGRSRDADELIALIRTSSDVTEDAIVRVETEALAANVAFQRGDYAEAAELAAAAMTPVLRATNWQDYAAAWLVRIRSLQRAGELQTAAREVAAFGAWAEAGANARQRMYATLMQADQARAERDTAKALQCYVDAMTSAERLGIPEDVVVVGE
ncbi:MAG TPA: hypothetical protein VGC30_04885, partial [Dokdonella sp.]